MQFRSDAFNYNENGFKLMGEQVECMYETTPKTANLPLAYDQTRYSTQTWKKVEPASYPVSEGYMVTNKRFDPIKRPATNSQTYFQSSADLMKLKYDLSQENDRRSQSFLDANYSSPPHQMSSLGNQNVKNMMSNLGKTSTYSHRSSVPLMTSLRLPYSNNQKQNNNKNTMGTNGNSMYDLMKQQNPQSPKQPTSYSNMKNEKTTEKCIQTIENMYFEIKGQNSKSSECMFTIKKMKDSICQLDLMFESFNLGDPNCQRDYFSVDGERICGSIPKDTMRSYKFTESNFQIYIKTNSLNDSDLNVKGRQVECKDTIQNQSDKTKPSSYQNSKQQYGSKDQFLKSDSEDQFLKNGQHEIGTRIQVGPQPSSQQSQVNVKNNYPFSVSQINNEGSYMGMKEPDYKEMDKYMSRRSDISQPQTFSSNDYSGKYCDQTITSMKATITSPNYPNDYGHNLYCKYTIQQARPEVCAVDLKFESFNIEDDPKCGKDYLEIDAGRICGTLPPVHERM